MLSISQDAGNNNSPLLAGGATISEVDFSQVSPADISAWLAYGAAMTAEAPLSPFQLSRIILANLPSYVTARLFVARDPEGTVAAEGRMVISRAAGRGHVCHIHVGVHPDRRGRGIGRAMLGLVLQAAGSAGKSLLIGWTTDRLDAGSQFAAGFGAQPLARLQTSKVRLSDLNINLLHAWLKEVTRQANDYEMMEIEGAYPDDMLPGILELRDCVTDSSPEEALLPELPITSLGEMRLVEAWRAGQRRRSAIVVHKSTGEIAGFTEIHFPNENIRSIRQAATIVHPTHRRIGLGKWLKATMLQWIVSSLPEAEEIVTANGISNVPILEMNGALGFERWMVHTAWEIPLGRVVNSRSGR